ncbi:MAG: hypothetical protein ACI4SS_01915, partial [Clostridia bacterium]
MNNKFSSAKRIISALVAVIMLAAFMPAAMAADTSVINAVTGEVFEDTIYIDVYLRSEKSPSHVLAIITKNGTEATYANALAMGYGATESGSWINPENSDSNYFLAADDKTDLKYTVVYNGGYGAAFEVKMPDKLPTGNYRLTVGVNGGVDDVIFDDIIYVGYADRQRLLDSINGENASAQSLVSVLNSLSVAFDVSGSNSEYYKALNSDMKLKFAQYILDNKGEEEVTISNFGALANQAFIVAYVDAEYSSSDKNDRALAALGLKVLKDNSSYIGL